MLVLNQNFIFFLCQLPKKRQGCQKVPEHPQKKHSLQIINFQNGHVLFFFQNTFGQEHARNRFEPFSSISLRRKSIFSLR
jgi:hypothetical protein